MVLNSFSATMYGLRAFLWSIGLVNYVGHPQPPQLNWARVYCGCKPGPHSCGSPSRQDDGETRAPALHTLDDVLRFRGDEEYRAVLLHHCSNKQPSNTLLSGSAITQTDSRPPVLLLPTLLPRIDIAPLPCLRCFCTVLLCFVFF